MLELFLVIYLCRRIKNTLQDKGYKTGLWQFWVVLAWFGLEIGGMVCSLLLGSDLLVAMLSGILCAAGGAIALQRHARSLPDISTNVNSWMDNMGKEDDYR